jgi:hypothetical protein|tara:strand:- start:9708 stop:10250 length:543 start_codon:yes stop_codon:yes gene_type:complete
VKTYDFVKSTASQASDEFITANGYIMHNSTTDVDVEVVPYGHQYPAPLVTSSQPNQKDGITNGTFTSDANATASARPATTISGNGSGATFVYVFDANGDLDSIKADGAGTGYLVGDHLSITTTSAHGSQTIKFRLVKGSNRAEVPVTLIHDRTNPLAFEVEEYKVLGDTDRTVFVLLEHS